MPCHEEDVHVEDTSSITSTQEIVKNDRVSRHHRDGEHNKELIKKNRSQNIE
jgi:hypothetical protein